MEFNIETPYTDEINCPSEERIKILYVHYGQFQANCHTPNAREKLAEVCDGQSHCLLEASEKFFGDFCPGIFKILHLKARCIKSKHLHPYVLCQ